jgi:predicted RNase H-like HicB family nuclease
VAERLNGKATVDPVVAGSSPVALAMSSKPKNTCRANADATGNRECEYTVIFEPDLEEGGWVATAPVLGVTTQGESLAETRRMIREAITGYVQGLRDEGMAIPTEGGASWE